MLLGAVGVLLLVACATIVNLIPVRASSRRSEMALMAALGAGRGRCRVMRRSRVRFALSVGRWEWLANGCCVDPASLPTAVDAIQRNR